MGEFRLEVREFQDLTRWRWELTDAGGTIVADHEVRLDAGCWQYEAFTDLLGYLAWHVVPDRRAEDEARIVAGAGAWIGSAVLGPVADALVERAQAEPVTVRVVLPEDARSLVFRPLELAHVNGVPLSLQDVALVMQLDGDAAGKAPVGERLRVLGLFSLPDGGQPLNLRRERHALVQLIGRVTAEGRSADVRVLQYGVTRDRLRSVLDEAEGWDIIHISGHGAPGELLLERDDGSPDQVTARDLAELLALDKERVKLVTVSACWSAALTAAEQRRLLGLPAPGSQQDGTGAPGAAGPDRAAGAGATDAADGEADGFASGTVATELARRLRCAVLAMRYPVADDFAIELAGKLYDLLASKGQALPKAVGTALARTMAQLPPAACPALSAGTPALFGSQSVGLRLTAPASTGTGSFDVGPLKMAGFPPQPDRFVGRTAVMTRASAALAGASGVPGVLLHGMPGGGKTACALELAYTHEHAFARLVWFKAPDEGLDATGALNDFALTLERELPGFQMLHVLADEAKLAGFTPRLTELLERNRVLIVIDNAESLLTTGGEWHDARWGRVVRALCAHAGHGRVVLTSRRRPASLSGLRVETVDALSLDEALLLIRELPHLRDLVWGELPGVERETARKLALGVLNVAQGHPKLLELADGQAGDPGRLSVLVQAGDQAWQRAGGLPEGFFSTGEPQAAGEDYFRILAAWTDTVSDGLATGQRTLFWFLCCLEEGDRLRPVVEVVWANSWPQLGLDGQPPGLDEALATLVAWGLIAVRPETEEGDESYGIHPGVAAGGRAQAGQRFRDAVDTELGAYWRAVADHAREREGEARTTRLVVHAGLAAAPYLVRRTEWGVAVSLLEDAFNRDPVRATAAAVLPALQAIAAASQDPSAAGVLARVLELIDPTAAESQTRAIMDAAVARGDYWSAAVAAGNLIEMCVDSGRLAEALSLTDQTIDYTRRAGLGPWTQLGEEVRRLKVLNVMGRADQVLAEVQRLRARMQTLPGGADQPENVTPWNVREALLDTGCAAARQLGYWSDALDLNAVIIASRRDRGAPVMEIARTRFNDYMALIRLGRIDDALALLLECRQTFADAHDVYALGKVLGALADVENQRGRDHVAIGLEQDALRYKYLAGDVIGIPVSHHNLGYYLYRHADRPAGALGHHLAAALIRVLMGAEGADGSMYAAALDLRAINAGASVPADVADLCSQVAAVPGVELDRLLAALAPDPDTAEQALDDLIVRVRTLAPALLASRLAAWEPVIAALLAADDGDAQAATVLDEELALYEDSADWGTLVAALRRLRAGETGPELLTGLDEIDAAIVTRAVDARDGKVSIPVALWAAIGIGPLLGDLVAGGTGDAAAAGRARPQLESMAQNSDLAAVAGVLGRILDGERDPGLGGELDDPVLQAVVATVLHHLGVG